MSENANGERTRFIFGFKSEPAERIHATPGYPFGVSVGLTFRFGAKE